MELYMNKPIPNVYTVTVKKYANSILSLNYCCWFCCDDVTAL